MYKYEVRFKYNIDSNGGCTSKTAVITYPKKIYALTDAYADGGKGKNEVLTKAVNELGLDPTRVEALADKKKLDGGWYKLTFLGEANTNDNENKNISNPEAAAEAKKAEAEASARKAEAKSAENTAKWETYAKLGTAAFSAATSTGKEVKETTDYLSKMIFSDDPNELANQLSEICSMWGGAEKYMLVDNTKAVKKAAFDKFEFGMLKLQQVGTPSQIEFFNKKQKEMKPKKFFGLF